MSYRNGKQVTRRGFLGGVAGLAALGAGGIALRPLAAAEDDALPQVDRDIRALAADAPLSMQFTGSTEKEARQWQQAFGGKLRELLGDFAPPARWRTEVERTVEREDHTRQELVLQAAGHPDLPVYLLLPKNAAGERLPGIVALHGHGDYGYDPVAGVLDKNPGVERAIRSANYDYGLQLCRRGYAVAAPCFQPFGRRIGDRGSYSRSDPCAVTFVRLALLGKLLLGENLRDALWAKELLAGHDRVDADRLAVAGLSYGGRMTMMAAAVEPAFRAAVVSGALNVMQERVQVRYSCGAQVIPGLLQYGDVPEIGGLIAPRHAVWETGSRDGLIREPWAGQAMERMRRVYAAYGAEDRLLRDRFEGGHRFNGEVAVPLLARVLKGDTEQG